MVLNGCFIFNIAYFNNKKLAYGWIYCDNNEIGMAVRGTNVCIYNWIYIMRRMENYEIICIIYYRSHDCWNSQPFKYNVYIFKNYTNYI